ncbi:MAG TPA: hypothetical protein VJG13_10250 [Thermoanaerobaculia bacterium]|nr:hypothetical protein [Thermoanaerobaculia bacterium]
MEIDPKVMVNTDLLSAACRRAIALGAALQLTEATLGREPIYGRYLVEHLDETVQRIEGQLKIEAAKGEGTDPNE